MLHFKKSKTAGRLCCVYTGYLSAQNAMDDMLEISKHFLHEIDFHIIGDGPSRKELEAQYGNQQNVFFHGAVNISSAQACQQFADVLYIGWQNKEIYKFGVTLINFLNIWRQGSCYSGRLCHMQRIWCQRLGRALHVKLKIMRQL